MTQDESLTKIYVDLPNHWATGGESFWAAELGDNLYEIRNAPFHAYNLNFGDVVRAISDSPEQKAQIREVVRRSGNQTLRVIFFEGKDRQAILDLLASLSPMKVSYEGATERYFALDLEPGADINRVRDVLDKWAEEGWVQYETCEERVPGGFDARPEEDQEGGPEA